MQDLKIIVNAETLREIFTSPNGKLIDFSPIHRELDVNSIISKIDESLILIKTIEDKRKLNEFNWDLVPVLKNI